MSTKKDKTTNVDSLTTANENLQDFLSKVTAKDMTDTLGVQDEDCIEDLDIDLFFDVDVKDFNTDDAVIKDISSILVDKKKIKQVVRRVALTDRHIKDGYEIFIDKSVEDITWVEIMQEMCDWRMDYPKEHLVLYVQANGSLTVLLRLVHACSIYNIKIICEVYQPATKQWNTINVLNI